MWLHNTLTAEKAQPQWQRALANAVRDVPTLLRHLGLTAHDFRAAPAIERPFPLRVPWSYIARMRHADPTDPLLLQVLPSTQESIITPGFTADPVGDHAAQVAPGLLQKYTGRVLLLLTGACAIHCRYCFRQAFPYTAAGATPEWSAALQYIRQHPSVSEVILSGGDPLLLSDGRLTELVDALDSIPHLQRLRLHTRLPIVLPERVNPELFSWLGCGRLQHTVVLHANHPHEYAPPAAQALQQLQHARVNVLNQSVLLAGINDTPEVLCQLQETGFTYGILPYYLHLLDRAQGTAHFAVPESKAQKLHQILRERLPGYLVPRLVREEAGRAYKTPIT